MRSRASINIDKIRILLVCHVHKRRGIQLASNQLAALLQLGPDLLLSLVLPDKGISEDEEERELDAVGHEKGADAQVIRGRLVGLVEEGAGNVAHAGAEPDHARDNHLLGLATRVGGDEGERDDERGLVRAGQVAVGNSMLAGGQQVACTQQKNLQANQSSHIGIPWRKQESEGARNRRQHKQRADERAAVVRHKLVCQRTQPDPNDHQDTLRNAQQSRLQRVEIQALDDEGREVGNAAVGNVGHKSKQREQPRLVVQVGLLDLLPVDPVLLHARLVASHAGNHDELLVMGKPPDCAGRVGQKDEEADAPERTEGADNDEFVAP